MLRKSQLRTDEAAAFLSAVEQHFILKQDYILFLLVVEEFAARNRAVESCVHFFTFSSIFI